MSLPVFLFGTLRHDPVRAAVLGGADDAQAGRLVDHAVMSRAGNPVLVARDGETAEGLFLRASDAQLGRLDDYERLFGYSRQALTDGQGQRVWVYTLDIAAPDAADAQPWSFTDWVERLGCAAALASAEIMALRESHPSAHLAMRYPMLLAHACARLRAATESSPETLRRAAGTDDVVPVSTAHPYAYFFGVQSDDLRFRRFDGSLSPVVRRAAFVMSDAVTLLPYDPVRDCVLLVEQFRYGLYLRGAVNCWSLEAIAGRIDAGETPVQAALREAREEAGLALDAAALEAVGKAYPSPGCVTECLFQFVAICTLPENDGAVNGLESEDEDIRRHVIPFARLMGLAQSGEVQNGPLLTSIFWLALNRDRLRGA